MIENVAGKTKNVTGKLICKIGAGTSEKRIPRTGNLKKIEKIQTKDRIADILRNEILAGSIEDGEELTQEGLAESLGVSRMPVREALQILEQEGLLLRLPNRHMRVIGMGAEELKETLQLAAAVEIQVLRILKDRNVNLEVLSSLTGKDREFREAMAEYIENGYVRQMYRRMIAGYPACAWACGMYTGERYNQAILEAYCQESREQLCRCVYDYYSKLTEELIHKYRR